MLELSAHFLAQSPAFPKINPLKSASDVKYIVGGNDFYE